MSNPISADVIGSPAATLARQVQWQHPMVVQGGIDQTRLAITDGISDQRPGVPFSFMVMGDTDAGEPDQVSKDGFSEMMAQQMMAQMGESRFLLHTGDVTYPIGSYQNYLKGFLQPYSKLLSAIPARADYGTRRARSSDRATDVVFNRPMLPVPGNHDYAELPFGKRGRQRALRWLCDRLRQFTGIDLGQYGGEGGEAYGQTFLDDLSQLSPEALKYHLLNHYSVPLNTVGDDRTDPAYCLNYSPGQFTRLPNRYYSFHYGGIDFFALDSNTWNSPTEMPGFDQEQLDWLEQGLVDSWRSPDSVGRILYLHHSPYTTETSRWQQPETLWVRRHLRHVLDNVKAALALDNGEQSLEDSPLVDLVISGHAHCLEHLKTTQTGHGDAHLNWLVCGGSGLSLRRARQSGTDILETMIVGKHRAAKVVAHSHLYAGAHGWKEKEQHFHSFVKIDVHPNAKKGLVVRPFVVAKGNSGWQTRALEEIHVGGSFLGHSRYFRDDVASGRANGCSDKLADSDSSMARVS